MVLIQIFPKTSHAQKIFRGMDCLGTTKDAQHCDGSTEIFPKMIKTKSCEIQRSSEGKLPLLVFPVSVKLSVLQSPARLGEKVKALERVVSRSCVVSQYVSYEFLVKCSVTDSPAVFLVDCLVVLLEVFLQAVKHKDTSYFC